MDSEGNKGRNDESAGRGDDAVILRHPEALGIGVTEEEHDERPEFEDELDERMKARAPGFVHR
jgi:hypothetical protein